MRRLFYTMGIKDRISKLLHKNKYTLPILQGLGMIALVTAISVLSIHFLLGETISDYAEANPEIAYGTEEATDRETEEIPERETEEIPDRETMEIPKATEEVIPETETEETVAMKEPTETVNQSDAPDGDVAGESAETDVSDPVPEYNTSVMVHFYDPNVDSESRYTYEPGFYSEPLSQEVRDYITGISYAGTDDMVISYEDLDYVGLLYVDFNGLTQAGELICNKKISRDMLEIFSELYRSDYRIDSIYLVDNFGGDDTASMCADNTSCFNYRVVDGSSSLSKHAYGMAIDINPFYNPYIVFGAGEGGSDYISPAGSEIYVDRSASFPYKIDENDLCYKLFKAHGFTWGGNWNSCKDYQHFQKTP